MTSSSLQGYTGWMILCHHEANNKLAAILYMRYPTGAVAAWVASEVYLRGTDSTEPCRTRRLAAPSEIARSETRTRRPEALGRARLDADATRESFEGALHWLASCSWPMNGQPRALADYRSDSRLRFIIASYQLPGQILSLSPGALNRKVFKLVRQDQRLKVSAGCLRRTNSVN